MGPRRPSFFIFYTLIVIGLTSLMLFRPIGLQTPSEVYAVGLTSLMYCWYRYFWMFL